jgi:hypothetical protein
MLVGEDGLRRMTLRAFGVGEDEWLSLHLLSTSAKVAVAPAAVESQRVTVLAGTGSIVLVGDPQNQDASDETDAQAGSIGQTPPKSRIKGADGVYRFAIGSQEVVLSGQ